MTNTPRVYLCQFSVDIKKTVAFYPYSAGCVWAYAESKGTVTREQLGGIFFLKSDFDNMLDRFVSPDIVGFSNYLWNGNYNLELSKRIKDKFPNCIIVFGGPETPDTSVEFLNTNKHIDILVHQEGEVAFNSILSRMPVDTISNITYRKGDDIVTNPSSRIQKLIDVPSPYLIGLFDNLDAEGRVLNAILETDRGCPYKCTFCDWGSLTFNKVKQFGLEKIFAEIEWAGIHKTEFIHLADANFGIFKERALLVAQQLVATKKKYGYPKKFDTSWAKNSNDDVLEVANTLNKANLTARFDLSVQSLNTVVQENIERSNMGINKFDELVYKARDRGLLATVELILLLPGETFESWKVGLIKLLDHKNIVIEVNPAQLLKNSELSSPATRERFGIKSCLGDLGAWSSLFIKEDAEYITETTSMSYEDLQRSWQWTWCARLGHVLGITNIILEEIRKTKQLSSETFYTKWYEYITTSSGLLNEKFIQWCDLYLTSNQFINYTYEFGYMEELGNTRRSELLVELETFLSSNFSYLDLDFKDLVEYFNVAYFNSNISYPIYYKSVIIDHSGMGIFDKFNMFIGMTRRQGGWRCSITNKETIND